MSDPYTQGPDQPLLKAYNDPEFLNSPDARVIRIMAEYMEPLTRFDKDQYWAKLAGEVPGFEPSRHLEGRLLPQTDHMTRLTLVGADWALRSAGVQPQDFPDNDMAVITAATAGGYEFGQGLH